MNNQYLQVTFLALLFIFGCNSQKKSNEVASYKYEEEKVGMSTELRNKIPGWVVKGKICYGLVVQIDKNKIPIKGKPIKAKILQIQKDAIKMKALESVSLAEIENCTKMGLYRGDIWNEKHGDLFLTNQDAINALIKMNIYKSSDKATVDNH
ncbi:MAG: hypothetical protein GQ525_16240 [Draconibacterium sp.]|nr:hypothetical protein [Draconibacterium sp.]